MEEASAGQSPGPGPGIGYQTVKHGAVLANSWETSPLVSRSKDQKIKPEVSFDLSPIIGNYFFMFFYTDHGFNLEDALASGADDSSKPGKRRKLETEGWFLRKSSST